MTKPRKGEKYISEFAVLLRDAQPTWHEIEGEPDPRKRRENRRARDIAIDQLVTIFAECERRGQLHELPPEGQILYKQWKRQHGGELPRRKGGRPTDEHKKLWIAVSVAEALAAQAGKRKSVTQAIRHVHETLIFNEKRCVVPEATIRDYYYDPDPEWRRAFKAELAWRALPVTKQVPGPGAGAVRRTSPKYP